MSTAYVARQPIFDRRGEVVAYELLQRGAPGAGNGDRGRVDDDDAVTRSVTAKALVDFGLDQLVGDCEAFVNVPSRFLADGTYRVLPPGTAVLEVLERVVVTDSLISDVRTARANGYKVALDDYVGEERFDRLLPEVDIVKVDLVDVPRGRLSRVTSHVRKLAPRALLLAEKVETREQHAMVTSLGYHLFQGYFFAQPTVLNARQIPVGPFTLLRLIAALGGKDLDVAGIASIVASDPGLSYRLLRLANSAAVGLVSPVDSVERAATLMGADQIRRTAFLAAAIETRTGDEIAALALSRARTCELIARHGGGNGAGAFTVGLFSMLDVVLKVPLARAIAQLPLTDEVRDALTERAGPLGGVLSEAVAYERGDTLAPGRLPIVARAYLDAVRWSAQQRQSAPTQRAS